MTQSDIRLVFLQAGVRVTPVLLNDAFQPIELEFIQECWTLAVANLPAPLQTMRDIGGGKMAQFPVYVPGIFNCNKFSRWLSVVVELCRAAAAVVNHTQVNTDAIGPVSYLIGGNPADGHDIVWFIDEANRLRFLEPQTGEEVHLSSVEIASIFFEEAT